MAFWRERIGEMGKILGIAIQNYGSLKDISLGKLLSNQAGAELSNMTAIIGPSGNGKSTLADAFGFCRTVWRMA